MYEVVAACFSPPESDESRNGADDAGLDMPDDLIR